MPKQKLEEAVVKAKRADLALDEYLVKKKLITKDQYGQIIASTNGVVYQSLKNYKPNKEFVEKIPQSFAKKYYVLLFDVGATKSVVVTDDPFQEGLKEQLKKILSSNTIELRYCFPQDIEKFLDKYHSKDKKTSKKNILDKLLVFGHSKKKDTEKKSTPSLKMKIETNPKKSKDHRDEVEIAIEQHEKIISNKALAEILVSSKYVSKEDMQAALSGTEKEKQSLDTYLIEQKLITKDLIGQAIAESYKVPYADLNTNIPEKDLVLTIPKEIAYKHYAILYKREGHNVVIATDNPNSKELHSQIRQIFPNKKLKYYYSLPQDIENLLLNYREKLEERIEKATQTQERPAIKLLEEIMDEAITLKASDIHLEPEENDVAIRFRIDGVMQEFSRVQPNYYSNILNRIKVKSKLRIDQHLNSQDGSMVYQQGEKEVNLRVSIVPTLNGEKVVMRVLSKYVQGFALTEIGLSKENEKSLREASSKPFGMILVTGPTGSGKTTTLYSVLKLLNERSVNITTIEDPVEYRIKGVNQIQVSNDTGLNFAQGLRSVVRQDPDIILVGEIRDTETAEISVNAALTGHLLLSTFHSNDAATAIPRLLDMQIEPFLLASTLELVIAQRLVRKICTKCKVSYSLTASEIKKDSKLNKYMEPKETTLYKGEGCNACKGTGYQGRTAIFEVIAIDKQMKALILQNPSSQEVWKLAKKKGTKSLYEDGIEKIKNGVTTIEELTRVASPNEY